METRAPKHSIGLLQSRQKRSTYPSVTYSNVPGRFYLFHEAGTNPILVGRGTRAKTIRANLRTSERSVTDVRARLSNPLPPSAALPLCKGENVMSPLQRGTAAKRQGALTHDRPGVPIRSQY